VKNEWIKVKDKLPPIGEFVEVIYPDDTNITHLKRDFAVYREDDTGGFWTSEGMDERDWSKKGYGIKYWKPMSPDTKGRKPFIKTNRSGIFVVYMKKVV
jgi:hypothetical protein